MEAIPCEISTLTPGFKDILRVRFQAVVVAEVVVVVVEKERGIKERPTRVFSGLGSNAVSYLALALTSRWSVDACSRADKRQMGAYTERLRSRR